MGFNGERLPDGRITKLCDEYREACLEGRGRAEPLDHKHEVALRDELDNKFAISFDEIDRIIEWKNYSQGGRANLNQERVREVSGETVEDITRAALREARRNPGEIRRPFHILRSLPGIGIGAASVVLAFACPDDFCVVDRYARAAILGGGLDKSVTMKDAEDQIEALRETYRDSEYPLRDIKKAHYYIYATENDIWP